MNSDELGKLIARRDYIEEWFQRHREAQKIVPLMQDDLEQTQWKIEALKNAPAEASEIPLRGLSDQLNLENNILRNAVPMMPLYDYNRAVNSTAGTVTGSAVVYEHVSRVGDLGTEGAIAYSNFYTDYYRKLQEKQERINNVRSLIGKLDSPNTLQRFDDAFSAYMAYKSTTGKRQDAANNMRNVIYGVRGDLYERAKKWPKENMTWSKMAKRLASGSEGGDEFLLLEKQEKVEESLLKRLPDVLKDREGGSPTNLDDTWTLLIDYLYAVLGLTDFEKKIEKRT